jgi:hypothetical protein
VGKADTAPTDGGLPSMTWEEFVVLYRKGKASEGGGESGDPAVG